MGVRSLLFSHHNFCRIECELVHYWVGDSLCWSCAAYIKSLHLRAFVDSSGFVISFDFFVLYYFSVWASADEVQLICRCGITSRLHKLCLYSRGASSPVSLCSCFPFEVFTFPALHLKSKIKKCLCIAVSFFPFLFIKY